MDFLYQTWTAFQEPSVREALKDAACWLGGLWAAVGVLVATIKHGSRAACGLYRKVAPPPPPPPPPHEPSGLCRSVLAAMQENPVYWPATDRELAKLRCARLQLTLGKTTKVELLEPHKAITDKLDPEDLDLIRVTAEAIVYKLQCKQDAEERVAIEQALAGTVTETSGGLFSTAEARAQLAALQPEPKPKGRR